MRHRESVAVVAAAVSELKAMLEVPVAAAAAAAAAAAEEEEPKEGGSPKNKVSNSIRGVLCEECLKNPSKYKCPGCGFSSCCLECVRAHKQRTSCSGKRDRTSFVPLASFDDNCLISDYNLLEEILRQSDSAKRFRCADDQARQDLGPRWTLLRKQASKRRINLLYLAKGMTKRTENSSRYCKKRKCIFWRIEWNLHSAGLKLLDTGADENLSPAKILENHSNNHKSSSQSKQFRQVCKEPTESMRFLLAEEFCSREGKGYVELDPLEPLGSQLTAITIIEYPSILLVPLSSAVNLTITGDLKSEKRRYAGKEILPITDLDKRGGIPFREEEIEEEIEEGKWYF